jgi:hypothetical protein
MEGKRGVDHVKSAAPERSPCESASGLATAGTSTGRDSSRAAADMLENALGGIGRGNRRAEDGGDYSSPAVVCWVIASSAVAAARAAPRRGPQGAW